MGNFGQCQYRYFACQKIILDGEVRCNHCISLHPSFDHGQRWTEDFQTVQNVLSIFLLGLNDQSSLTTEITI